MKDLFSTRGVLLVWTILWMVFFLAWSAQAQHPSPSRKEVQGMVDLLEDQQKREAFVRDLRTFLEASEALDQDRAVREPDFTAQVKELLAIERMFEGFDRVSHEIVAAALAAFHLVLQTPEGLKDGLAFLQRPGNFRLLLVFLASIAFALGVALCLGLALRKSFLECRKRMQTLPNKILFGWAGVVLHLLPYGVIPFLLMVAFSLFPSFVVAQTIALLFFTTLFFYKAAVEILHLVFWPEDADPRLLPIRDENATYLYVWGVRFAKFTAFYWIILQSLTVAGLDANALYFIRAVLLLWFPFVLTVFFLQVYRDNPYAGDESDASPPEETGAPGPQTPEEEAKTLSSRLFVFARKYWIAPALVYCWCIFVLLLIRFEAGFHFLFRATLGTAVAVVGVFLAIHLVDVLFRKVFSVHERMESQFPGLEEKANRYIRILKKTFKGLVTALGVGVVAQVWGIPVSAFVTSEAGSTLILRLITIVITAGVAMALIELSQVAADYLVQDGKKGRKRRELSQKAKTLVPVAKTAAQIGIGFVGGIVVLSSLGVDTTPILAGAGILSLAVGFGSQTLVKDVINGLFILFEENVRIGDFVMVGSNGGTVESVGLRTVRLRDLHGSVHVIPNSSINTLINYTKTFSRAVMDVGVAYREDVDEVMGILEELGEGLRNDPEYGPSILEPIEIFGLDRFEDSAVIIRARLTTTPGAQWGIRREFNRRMKRVFDERGIEIPFPHTTIYMGEPKKGASPPLHVQVHGSEHMVHSPENPPPPLPEGGGLTGHTGCQPQEANHGAPRSAT